ncbi:hypothetical protein [Streptomyces sp. H39-S7]|uniref:hypothetical protein n=1 Tax=Streptomyces sp. H39-S7 TaxID=3004357 RepID=UPI0022AFC9A4|nr:hypothetical protein [Streptomyces sp. H39-S7]MCZ4125470.1 hypothetical protein [Streptomyces sp. H39-S7]
MRSLRTAHARGGRAQRADRSTGFQVGVAYTLSADDHVRRLTVGIRCPVDGALHLHLDNVHVTPSRS